MIYEKLGVILGVTFKILIEMKISNASKEAIVPFIIGDNNELWAARTGNDLVRLFQTYGFRDDVYNG
ncbi:MAG: phosphatidylserine synthase, partial [Alistipes sp.]|nr:phosphatidylserine synthase [Alistipes sp.]